MTSINYGGDDQQILTDFRKVVKSHIKLFHYQRDHVHNLLCGKHNYASGAFREGLLRDFPLQKICMV